VAPVSFKPGLAADGSHSVTVMSSAALANALPSAVAARARTVAHGVERG